MPAAHPLLHAIHSDASPLLGQGVLSCGSFSLRGFSLPVFKPIFYLEENM